MLTELHHKGGRICEHALQGKIRCPLIVRPTSEDVVTGNLFQVLKAINPRHWLSDLLNEGLGVPAFHAQVYRDLRISLWDNKPPYPQDLIPWVEGSTQVDVTITWENPPTTVFIEMKYGSELSSTTSRNRGEHGFPADQLSRNARVGLLECGYFQRPRLFESAKRDFVLLVIGPERGQPLVARYRDPHLLRTAIPNADMIPQLPRLPFIGELGYGDIVGILERRRRWLRRSERILVDQLTTYLEHKLATRPQRNPDLRKSPIPATDASCAGKGTNDLFAQGVSHGQAEARS